MKMDYKNRLALLIAGQVAALAGIALFAYRPSLAEIDKIEREYGPSTFPHLAMAQRLTKISNESTLARHFHTDNMTICSGCHHLGSLEAAGIPPCSTCHTVRDEPTSGTPTLLGAYHQQCLGCHEQMDPSGQKYTQDCTGCHKEKTSSDDVLAAHP